MRLPTVAVVTALSIGLLAGAASASGERAAGALRVKATFTTTWKFGDEHCPPGKPVNVACIRFLGKGPIAGLGMARTTYVKTIESNGCPVTQHNDAVITVPGEGTLTLTRPGKACGKTAPARVGPLTYAITAGTGAYEGATGSLVYRGSVGEADFSCGPCGTGEDSWQGTITLPGLDQFELTPPKIFGAVSKTVRAPDGAKGARVSYALKAVDAVDGPRPVTCSPRPGSIFKVGRTIVTCEAVDLNGNTATATFTITVTRS